MKKEYSTPEIEIYKYSEMDVITTSMGGGNGANPWSIDSKSSDIFA